MEKLRAGEPWRVDGSLTRNNESVQTVLDKKALVDAGVDVLDPGGYSGWYFPDEQVMLLDLGGRVQEARNE